ncbi:MAG: energy transducer TonB [Desulfobacteraceae bacterium]|nr:energy transducer TonB [Desulfobacteraceae bacterium]
MKRFLLAALLALTIHGLFFGFVPRPVGRKPPQKPHIVTISLVSYHPVKPTPAVKPARIIQERLPQKPPKKKQDAVIRPLPAKKTAKAPRKTLSAKKDVVKPHKKPMPPQKKRTKPLKSVTKLQKKAAKPDMRPKIPRKAVVASLIPEKKKASVTPPQSNHASRPTKADTAIPIEESVNPEEYLVPFPDIPEDSGVERGTEIASIPPVKVVREARPAYKDNPRPPYPKRARRRGYEGTVVLEVLVDRSGRVKELRILRSSGHTILDRAALKSVNGWLFEPGMVGDEKVDMWARVPVRFELRGG